MATLCIPQAGAQDCVNGSQYPSTVIAPNALGGLTSINGCNFFGEYSVVGPVVPMGEYQFNVTNGGYITVREGSYNGPVLAQGTSPVTAIATTVGNLYVHWNSDASCGSGFDCETTSVQFMLNCSPPAASVTPVDDCANNQFSLEVNVITVGDGGPVDLVYSDNGGPDQVVSGVNPGITIIGPFTVGHTVDLVVAHGTDPMCNKYFTGLESANTCPILLECGEGPVNQSYCYVNNDNNHWNYECSCGMPLIMIFSAGSIESNTWDHLRIYDGDGPLSPLLWENPSGTTSLAGLQVIAPSGQMYVQITSDASGSCESGSFAQMAWQVGCLDCTPATATFDVVTDCDNYEFSVEVDITQLGTDQTLDITQGGLGNILETATTEGVYTVGPFPANIPVQITLSNDENSLCNVTSASLVNPLCPQTIVCGGDPVDGQYCYGNSDSHAWSWQSSTGDALIIIFSAGSLESSSFDHLRIYNGPSNLSPLLWENGTGATYLSGLQVIAGSGSMYMEMSSDGSVSCQSGSYDNWVWQVGCLDCASPEAAFEVVTDCANMEFSVEVNITNLGSDPTLGITNNGGAPALEATQPGTYTVGPFPAASSVVITLVNDENTLCNISSASLTNPLCPTVLPCDGTLHQESYCYGNNDNHVWHWQSVAGQPLALEFSAGTIESSSWDHLRIYDGPGPQFPLLFDHNQTTTLNLAGLMVISTQGSIYMEMTSDASSSCQSGNQTEWSWTLGCLDCTNPGASYSIVEDCIHHSFSVALNVDSLGSGSFVRVANNLSADTLTNIPLGISMVGPFPMDSLVTLTVLNQTNDLCRVYSPQLTAISQNCVDTVCAAVAYEYCYGNHDTAWFAYQGTSGLPLTVEFLWGALGPNDFIQTFNGFSPSPDRLLWQGNLNGNVAGWAVNTTGAYSDLLLRIVSDGTYSCESGEISPALYWVVQCGAVGVEEFDPEGFMMYPNPTTGELNLRLPGEMHGTVNITVTDLAGRTVYRQDFHAWVGRKTIDLGGLQSGNYVVTIIADDWMKSGKLQILH